MMVWSPGIPPHRCRPAPGRGGGRVGAVRRRRARGERGRLAGHGLRGLASRRPRGLGARGALSRARARSKSRCGDPGSARGQRPSPQRGGRFVARNIWMHPVHAATTPEMPREGLSTPELFSVDWMGTGWKWRRIDRQCVPKSTIFEPMSVKHGRDQPSM